MKQPPHRTLSETEQNKEILRLVNLACSQPQGSTMRQKALAQIIRMIDRKLWRESTPEYQEALQQTWLYFCRNICEANTGERYNPSQSSIITWLNNYLKRRLQDIYIKKATAEKTFVSNVKTEANGEYLDILDSLEASPDIRPLLQELINWVQMDADGTLRATHIKGHPNANCQLLILYRLSSEKSWGEISEELGIPIATLSAFYQRKCIPKIQVFCESEGYL